jgi:DNA-directed RNA polymerase specialized sigma24 family protein
MSSMITGRGSEVVARFQRRIRWISESVAVAFGNQVDAEDLSQEAVILVLSYAGVAEGWHHGKLSAWERIAGGDEARVNALLARTLRLDLSRMTGRRLERAILAASLNNIPPRQEPSDDDFEDRILDQMRHGMAALRRKYPTLVRHFIDGYTERDIAIDEGVSVQAIWKRTAREKAALATAHGIPVGDLTSAA